MRLFTFLKIYANLTKKEVTDLVNYNKVTVNNQVVPLSWNVEDDDIVMVNNIYIERAPFKYYLYYKPIGITSTISDRDDSYIKQINFDQKMMLAGRLDKDSHGLMILSNDGNFINDILTNPNKEKEYIVKLEHVVTDEFIESIQKSYTIRGRDTKPMKVTVIDEYTINLVLTDGKYRQIRNIIKYCNNFVLDLKRIRIDKYSIGNMKPGEITEFNK